MKPLGVKNYGSIPHLSGSRRGPSDKKAEPGQEKIATQEMRRGDVLIVTEKIDGSNVGIAKKHGRLMPLTRAGHMASSSPYRMHHIFDQWVLENYERFRFLQEGERIVGEWCIQAHGTIYDFKTEPFFVFDFIDERNKRKPYDEVLEIENKYGLSAPAMIYRGKDPLTIGDFEKNIPGNGHHGARDGYEGGVWRVETNGKFNFVAKYVRPDKEDGKYLDSEVWNTWAGDSGVLRGV